VDLADPAHVAAVIHQAEGAGMVVFDTLTACWSGDENDNAAIAALDRQALKPIVDQTGASVVVVDHTGHPQAFVQRKGIGAARGASAKGQKADVVLELRPKGDGRFLIHHAKNRTGGGRREPDRVLEVVDAEHGGLVVLPTNEGANPRVAEMAEAMVEAIQGVGSLTTKALRQAVRGAGGKGLQDEAMELLRTEEPRRLEVRDEITASGQHGKVWRSVEG
jgi:hypothetical protein